MTGFGCLPAGEDSVREINAPRIELNEETTCQWTGQSSRFLQLHLSAFLPLSLNFY